MEITCTNLVENHALIENVIKNASFVALDLEFLGLEDRNKKTSLFDTPQERYEKTLHSVRRFPPAQLGLSFFTAIDDGERYKVDVYSIYLFKSVSLERDFSFTISSMTFLEDHGFNFNKLTREGVSHCNLDELQRILDRFHAPNGIEIFGAHLPPLLHHLQKLIRCEVARNRRRSTGSEGAEQYIFNGIPIVISQKLTEVQRLALLYKLQGCTPGVCFELKDEILMVRPSNVRKTDQKKEIFVKLSRELMGISDVILAIIEKKLPIVGHNSFRDVMYLYEYFVADLPRKLEEFKRAVRAVFPTICDTKLLAEESKNRLSWHGVFNYRMESLNAFFERMKADKRIPSPIYDFAESTGDKFRNPESSNMHDAGVDAVSTGQNFLRLAHLIASHERDASSCLPFKALLYSVRPLSNRLPVPLLGVPFVNLLGDEPPSRNPDAIILEMIAQDDEAGLGALRKELRGKFGRWRCDVRRQEDNRIHVATNTDTTYWRVFKYYSMHPDYRVLTSSHLPSSDRSLDSSTPSSPSTRSSSLSMTSAEARQLTGSTESLSDTASTISGPVSTRTAKCTLYLTELLVDGATLPGLKWWLAACTCLLAASMVNRRALH